MEFCECTAWEPNKDSEKNKISDTVWTAIWIAGNIKGIAAN